jgi:hypothetical protein
MFHQITVTTFSHNTIIIPINIISPPPPLFYLVSPDPILPHKVLALYIVVLPFVGFFQECSHHKW